MVQREFSLAWYCILNAAYPRIMAVSWMHMHLKGQLIWAIIDYVELWLAVLMLKSCWFCVWGIIKYRLKQVFYLQCFHWGMHLKNQKFFLHFTIYPFFEHVNNMMRDIFEMRSSICQGRCPTYTFRQLRQDVFHSLRQICLSCKHNSWIWKFQC